MTDPIACPTCDRIMERRDWRGHRKAAGHRRPPLHLRVPVREWPTVQRDAADAMERAVSG